MLLSCIQQVLRHSSEKHSFWGGSCEYRNHAEFSNNNTDTFATGDSATISAPKSKLNMAWYKEAEKACGTEKPDNAFWSRNLLSQMCPCYYC